MPQLVLLNGPAGVGKSTLARRYADAHPMTLALEIDVVRAMLGSWLEESERSGPAARQLALAVAAAHLEQGYDVIVPQLLTRREFVEELRTTTERAGARFRELALMADRTVVLDRLSRREEPAGGFSARALAAKQGHTPGSSYEPFAAALKERPHAEVIDAASLDDAYDELVRLLG